MSDHKQEQKQAKGGHWLLGAGPTAVAVLLLLVCVTAAALWPARSHEGTVFEPSKGPHKDATLASYFVLKNGVKDKVRPGCHCAIRRQIC